MGLAGIQAGVAHFVHDLQRHAQDLRRDEAQADVEVQQQLGQAMDGAAEAQVAHHGDLQPVDAPHLLLKREQVEQGLGGVLARAVAGVDHRDAGRLGGHLGRTDLRVAQDDDVGVLLQGADGVAQRLALADRAKLHALGDGDDTAAQALHGGDERGAGARARLIKQAGQHPSLQQIDAVNAIDHGPHLLGPAEDVAQPLAVKLIDGQDVPAGHAVGHLAVGPKTGLQLLEIE